MDEVAATTSSRPALGLLSSTAIAPADCSLLCQPPTADCLLRDLRRHFLVTRELLQDRQQPRVEEADLEQHQEGQRAVDLVDQRVEHRGGEIEAEAQLDQRLHADLLLVLLAGPLVALTLDA